MIQRLSHTTLFVLDQEKAYDFYVNKLGFKVHTDITMDGGFRWLTITAPADPKHEIVLVVPSAPILDEEQVATLKKLLEAGALGAGVFETDDCWATYNDLKAKGVQFKGEPQEQFYATECIMSDGVGNWFSVGTPKAH
jgi:catechol 2,3-dioxygenase-like lactoylglutathione lyase family enzyme